MKKISLLFSLLFFSLNAILARDGYNIKIRINDYDQKEIVLGYHYDGKQLVKDTVQINEAGEFIYKGEEALAAGLYMVLLVPTNNYFEMLIDTDDQHFSVETSANELTGALKYKDSKTNTVFQEYSKFLRNKGKEASDLRALKEKATGKELEKITGQLSSLDDTVKSFQQEMVSKHTGSLTAAIIKASWGVDLPEFSGTEDEVKQQRYQYYKSHFLDNVDLADPRLIRSPLLYGKVDTYFENLVYKIPDSIIVEIDKIIEKSSPNEDTYQYWVTHFLNKYAKESAEIVGMDAVYVHVAHKYYCENIEKTNWIEEEQRTKICKNADDLAPILIGKTAPNIRFQKRDQEWLNLHDVDAEFTVLYFWAPDCGHCKKSIPKAVEFYKEYADKGVKIVGVCNKRKDEVKECWEAVEERFMDNWINVTDPYLQGKTKFNITSNPRIFVMDKNKKIISKGIGSDQLKEVLDFHINKLQKEKEEHSK
jgi:thiol-disulfide isomerase/thioredoxin